MNGPADDGLSIIGRPSTAACNPVVPNGAPGGQVDQGQVGIETQRNAALAFKTENARWSGAGEVDQSLRQLEAKWKRPPIQWHAAKAQLAIQLGERFNMSE